MPAPLPPAITAYALAALNGRDIKGTGAAPLALALGMSVGMALLGFVAMCQVLPGQLATVVIPPAGSGDGTTAGPGTLQGAFPEVAAAGIATGMLAAQGLLGENTPKLGLAVGACISRSLDLFVQNVTVKMGATITAFVTTAPGSLEVSGKPLGDWKLEALCKEELEKYKIDGDGGKKLAGVLAEVLGKSLGDMVSMLKVAPGQALTPMSPTGPTLSPGKLL